MEQIYTFIDNEGMEVNIKAGSYEEALDKFRFYCGW